MYYWCRTSTGFKDFLFFQGGILVSGNLPPRDYVIVKILKHLSWASINTFQENINTQM
jgi:hypothetical protein